MAGQGKMLSSLGTLMQIIAGVQGIPLGVCYDTAHVHGYGVDLTTTTDIYDPAIKLFHINDSEVAFNSKKDRHASLGTGTIPLAAFKRIAQIKGVPFILETPLGNEKYDLEVFRALAN
jgi:deoxyribonuclease-4